MVVWLDRWGRFRPAADLSHVVIVDSGVVDSGVAGGPALLVLSARALPVACVLVSLQVRAQVVRRVHAGHVQHPATQLGGYVQRIQ